LDDNALHQLISNDGVDVLIDPSGHTSGNRLPVFGMRSAPLQMTWLGHPNTTGLSQMDWRVTDSICDPVGSEALYSEQLYRMPLGNFCVYRPLVARPHLVDAKEFLPQAPPCTRKKFVTFGSCNNLAKLSDDVIETWSKILLSVPGSKLLIEAPGLSQREFREYLVRRFELAGIKEESLDLRERDTDKQYLIYNEIDIALDPFPCSGGTTSFDLLWMGLPLVTLSGDAFVGRMGEMLLHQLNSTEWIAKDIAEYIQIAMSLAEDRTQLAEIRRSQREKMSASPLMDEVGFARDFMEFLTSGSHRSATSGAG